MTTTPADKIRKIFIISGEPSGDFLGERLMLALQALAATRGYGLSFQGVGGERMLASGLQPLFPQRDLALFGLFEILPKLFLIFQRLRQTVATIKAARPDIVITIDSPDFVFRVGQRLRGSSIKVIHYVAPSVWAWRPGRAKKIAEFLTHLLTLFPFEPPYFTKEGLPATFVGHPLIENQIMEADGTAFRLRYDVPANAPLLVLLPGSRGSEVSKLLPIFQATVDRLLKEMPDLHLVIPTLPHVAKTVRKFVKQWQKQPLIVQGDREKYDAFQAAQAALCASGTVTLELALANLPMVVAYRINTLTAFLYRRLFTTKYFSLVNILLQREAVPELLQENCTPEKLATVVRPLLQAEAARAAQQQDLRLIPPLAQNGTHLPSDLAAAAIFEYLA